MHTSCWLIRLFLFYALSTVFQSYNGGKLTYLHSSLAGLLDLLSCQPVQNAPVTTGLESVEGGELP